jgi:hypothetical protein
MSGRQPPEVGAEGPPLQSFATQPPDLRPIVAPAQIRSSSNLKSQFLTDEKKDRLTEACPSVESDERYLQTSDTRRRDWRKAKPRPRKPSSIMAQVAGSGTAAEMLIVSLALPAPVAMIVNTSVSEKGLLRLGVALVETAVPMPVNVCEPNSDVVAYRPFPGST